MPESGSIWFNADNGYPSETHMTEIRDIVGLGPVIPVLAFDSVEEGEAVCRALYAGGVKVFEITLRTAAGFACIEAAARIAEDVVVGVGTLTSPGQCALARAAGARFGVSPGFSESLHHAAVAAGLPLLPGVMTPSDILAAMAAGYTTLKLFPAEQAGGIKMLKALAGPFPGLSFCPTGGVTEASAPDFLALANVVCVGGSWLTPKTLVKAGDWAAVSRLARAASALRARVQPA